MKLQQVLQANVDFETAFNKQPNLERTQVIQASNVKGLRQKMFR
jgi:hypothetical protein